MEKRNTIIEEDVKAYYQREIKTKRNDGTEEIVMIDDLSRPKYSYHITDGILNGLFQEWWNNGRLRYEINYVAKNLERTHPIAVRDGDMKLYTPDGRLKEHRIYLNGKLVRV